MPFEFQIVDLENRYAMYRQFPVEALAAMLARLDMGLPARGELSTAECIALSRALNGRLQGPYLSVDDVRAALKEARDGVGMGHRGGVS